MDKAIHGTTSIIVASTAINVTQQAKQFPERSRLILIRLCCIQQFRSENVNTYILGSVTAVMSASARLVEIGWSCGGMQNNRTIICNQSEYVSNDD